MEVQTRVPRTESVLEVGHRKLFVTEAGTGEPWSCCTAAGPERRGCRTTPATSMCSPTGSG